VFASPPIDRSVQVQPIALLGLARDLGRICLYSLTELTRNADPEVLMVDYWPNRPWLNGLVYVTVAIGMVWYYFGPVGNSPFTFIVAAMLAVTGAAIVIARRYQRARDRSAREEKGRTAGALMRTLPQSGSSRIAAKRPSVGNSVS
jgi:hypothetical protein